MSKKTKNKLKIYISKVNNNNYSCEISNRKDSTLIESKNNFTSYKYAKEWGEETLHKIKFPYLYKTAKELGVILLKNPNNKQAFTAMSDKLTSLSEDLYLLKTEIENKTDEQAIEEIKVLMGRNNNETIQKAIEGIIDSIDTVTTEAIADLAIKQSEKIENNLKSKFQQPSETAEFLLNSIINNIPGKKQITVNSKFNHQVFDVKEDGYIGYEDNHINQLYCLIDESLESRGSMIIRQFIPNSEEKYLAPNGKTINMPWKAIYGILLQSPNLIDFIDAETLEECCCQDLQGNPIPPENFVIYKDISEFFHIEKE